MTPAHVPFLIHVPLGDLTADALKVAAYLHRKAVLTSVALVNQGAISGASNKVVLQLKKGTTVVAALDSETYNAGAGVADKVAAALTIVSGQEEQSGVLTLNYDETGTVGFTDAVVAIAGYWKETA